MSRLLTYLYEIVLVAAVPLHSRLALSSPISFIYWFCCYAVGPVPVNKQVKRPATKGIQMKQTTLRNPVHFAMEHSEQVEICVRDGDRCPGRWKFNQNRHQLKWSRRCDR